MVGSIDPRLRDNPWDPLARKGRWRVWNSHRGKPSWPAVYQPHQQAGHMDASDPIRPSKTLAARGPSTYGSLRSQGRRRRARIRANRGVDQAPARGATLRQSMGVMPCPPPCAEDICSSQVASAPDDPINRAGEPASLAFVHDWCRISSNNSRRRLEPELQREQDVITVWESE